MWVDATPLNPAPSPQGMPFVPGLGVRPVLEFQAGKLGRQPFLTLPDGRLSYGETDELANRVANTLASLGYGPGDIVMARCVNGAAMIGTWFGCIKLGAVFMPVNHLLTGAPLQRVMAHSRAKAVVCDASLYPALSEIRSSLPHLQHVLLVRAVELAPGTLAWDDLVERATSAVPSAFMDDPAAPAKLMYTSGTTGIPKGVVWSRTCEATWGRAYGTELVGIEEGEGAYCCLPLSHVTCQGTTLSTLWQGGHLSVDAQFDPFRFWERVRAADASVFTFVGTILSVLARLQPRADDLDNPVRRILGAAAPVDRWREIEDRFGVTIAETYGQTETASCWMAPHELPMTPGSMGRPVATRFDVQLVSDAASGTGGPDLSELWMRPLVPHVMFEGYLRADGGIDSPYDAEGWYRTGDLVRHGREGEVGGDGGGGNYFFAGRLREAIRRRGEMISSSDIEYAALSHPGVLEAAAVGVPDDDGVEDEVKLALVAKPATSLDPDEVYEFIKRLLPRFMVPRYIDIRSSLPKTPTTRVRKFVLKDEGSAGVWDAKRRWRSRA